MAITVNIYYTGEDDAAQNFMHDMIDKGIVDRIRKQEGNLRYEYFIPVEHPNTILLIDSWIDQFAIDIHHKSSMMNEIIKLREKYNLHMKVERYTSDEYIPENDKRFIRE